MNLKTIGHSIYILDLGIVGYRLGMYNTYMENMIRRVMTFTKDAELLTNLSKYVSISWAPPEKKKYTENGS